LVVVNGLAHGTALLSGATASTVISAVLAFVRNLFQAE
jgi:hypothetical protein